MKALNISQKRYNINLQSTGVVQPLRRIKMLFNNEIEERDVINKEQNNDNEEGIEDNDETGDEKSGMTEQKSGTIEEGDGLIEEEYCPIKEKKAMTEKDNASMFSNVLLVTVGEEGKKKIIHKKQRI